MTEAKRILLVEDNSNDAELILAALADLNLATDVLRVHDGVEALDYLHRRGSFNHVAPGNPDVVLLDVKMPRVSGLDVLREIRASEALRAVPVVMLTSSREERDLRTSYELGANGYVVKPVEYAEFSRAVKQLGEFWAQINQPPVARRGRRH